MRPGSRLVKIVFEGENLLVFTEQELNQRIRGSRIGFIPQDPLLSLNPVFKVGAQLLEIMRDHAPKAPAGATTSSVWSACCAGCGCLTRTTRWSAIRTNSPAANGNDC